jgi:hypothetical protein
MVAFRWWTVKTNRIYWMSVEKWTWNIHSRNLTNICLSRSLHLFRVMVTWPRGRNISGTSRRFENFSLWPRFRYRLSDYDSLTWKVKGWGRGLPSFLGWLQYESSGTRVSSLLVFISCLWSADRHGVSLIKFVFAADGQASRYVDGINSVWWFWILKI